MYFLLKMGGFSNVMVVFRDVTSCVAPPSQGASDHQDFFVSRFQAIVTWEGFDKPNEYRAPWKWTNVPRKGSLEGLEMNHLPTFNFQVQNVCFMEKIHGFLHDSPGNSGQKKLSIFFHPELLGRVDVWWWWITALDVQSCQRASRNTSIVGMGTQGDSWVVVSDMRVS